MKRDRFGRPQDLTTTQPISHDVLKEKYLKPGEDGLEDLYRRVARALASVEAEPERAKYEALFLGNLHAGAIGAGRIMSAAGTAIQATLINCFVQPVGDCIQGVDDEGNPGIYEALREAAETMRRGGGVGYDFSRIRPVEPKSRQPLPWRPGPAVTSMCLTSPVQRWRVQVHGVVRKWAFCGSTIPMYMSSSPPNGRQVDGTISTSLLAFRMHSCGRWMQISPGNWCIVPNREPG
ncbi:conserved hypothetical protein [sediment metagenome]|uniref:Ribonucleotide reductase large subunit N-terminal domain-containing protein n=1 Tax=sediment metagenome TaxID=749907 RepID=D9PG20_9ZZZZ